MNVILAQGVIKGTGSPPYPLRRVRDIMCAWFFVEQAMRYMTHLIGTKQFSASKSEKENNIFCSFFVSVLKLIQRHGREGVTENFFAFYRVFAHLTNSAMMQFKALDVNILYFTLENKYPPEAYEDYGCLF